MSDLLNGASAPIDIDPELRPHLARLRAAGGEDDTRTEADILDDLDGAAAALLEVMGGWEKAESAKLIAQEVARLQATALARPEALGALREAVSRRKRILGLDRPQLPDAAESALALIGSPPASHAVTGLETLDGITDGGFTSGKFHVIAGEPNVGKTSLALQLACAACEDGWVVGFHVADVDDRTGILGRIAQANGQSRLAFHARDKATIEKTAAVLRRWGRRFSIVDEAADGRTLDDTAEALIALGALEQRLPVLFLDSLQTVQLRWATEPRTDKDRIDKIVRRLVEWTRRGLTVVCTCEIPRGFYTGPKKRRSNRDAPPALAAFKGSGNIEYAAWTALVITRIRGEADAVRVEVPKNKQGREDVTFKLERTASRVGYEDVGEIYEAPSAREEEQDEAKAVEQRDAKIEAAARRLVPILVQKLQAAGTVGLTARGVRERLVGKNLAKDRSIEIAVAERSIESRPCRGYERYYAAGFAPPADPAAAADEEARVQVALSDE